MAKLKRKQRLGRHSRRRTVVWSALLIAFFCAAYAAYRYTGTTEVEVPVARVRKGDFTSAFERAARSAARDRFR